MLIMRRIITFVLLVTTLIACGDRASQQHGTAIEIAGNSEVWISGQGGTEEVVTCSLSGAPELQLQATSNVAWLDVVRCGSSTVWYKAQKNDSDDLREGKITITFGDKSCTLSVIQRPYADREFQATTLSGSYYYGKDEHSGMYNYYIVLSDSGISELGDLYTDSEYYFIDIYSTKLSVSSTTWRMPHGTYSIDDGSIGLEYSYYASTNGDYYESYITKAVVNVDHRMIEARLELEDGTSVNVWYRGALATGSNDDDTLSTLHQNYTFNIKDATFVGSIDDDGRCQLLIFEDYDSTTESYSGDVFQFTLLLEAGATDVVGTYHAGSLPGSFVAGHATQDDDDTMTLHDSWYMTSDYTVIAPMTSGELTIEKNHAGNYIFSIDMKDDAGYKLLGTIRGSGKIVTGN